MPEMLGGGFWLVCWFRAGKEEVVVNCSIEIDLSIRESHAISKSWDAASIDLLYAWCTDASRSTRVFKMRCLSLASVAISRPSSGVQKDSRPHMAQVYIQPTEQAEPRTPLQHFSPYSARQLHHCLQWEHRPAYLPNQAALSISAGRIRAVCARCTPSAQHARLQ